MTSLLDEVAIALERIVAERVLEARSDVTERWLPEFAKIEAERNAACAERDALRERAEAAEAKLLEVRGIVAAPQCVPLKPEEVDGFRVGDLVRFDGEALPLLEVLFDETVGSFGTVERNSPYRRKSCSQLQHMARKPVEVGDTVRVTDGSYVGVRGPVDCIVDGEAYVRLGDGWGTRWLPTRSLVAVAP